MLHDKTIFNMKYFIKIKFYMDLNLLQIFSTFTNFSNNISKTKYISNVEQNIRIFGNTIKKLHEKNIFYVKYII